MNRLILVIAAMLSVLVCGPDSIAQEVIGLDNWFNRETDAKTGLPFHYLWNDSADSGFSRWGDIFTQKRCALKTLEQPDDKSLKDISIYIIVDPDSTAETATPNYIGPDHVKAIERWVRNGGVLVLLANDGKHCELTHLNQLSTRFGMVFSNVMLRQVLNNQYEMGAFTTLPDHPVFRKLKKIYLKEVSSIVLSKDAKPVLTDQGKVIMAECSHGKGFVFAVGDPWLYNEYIDHDRLPEDFENRKAAENLTDYLLVKSGKRIK